EGLKQAGLPLPGGGQGGSLQTWQERRQVFLSAIENERRVTGLVLFFIVIVAGFGLFATLSALVREKIRDLGILAALGYTPLRRAALLFFVGSLASGLGALLGYGSAWWIVARREWVEAFLRERLGIVIFNPDIYVVQGLPALWISQQALTLTLAAFGVGLLFTLIPALRAASFSPTRALRYE
ncbi:MAG: ABC transporter permease, partial [Planctomycetota bacterium]